MAYYNGKKILKKILVKSGSIEGVEVFPLVDDGKLIAIYNNEAKATEISIDGADNIWIGLSGTNCRYDFSTCEGNIIIEDFNEREFPCTYVVENLAAENIKSGVTILGHTGTYEGEGSGGTTLKNLLDNTKSCYYLFYKYSSVTSVDDLIKYSDTENVTNMYGMFYDCVRLQTIPQLDTGNATEMNYMFRNCRSIKTIPQLNASKVTNTNGMFIDCVELQTIPQLDTSKVTNVSMMFSNCVILETIEQVSMRSVSAASYANHMFRNCKKLTNLNLIDIAMTVQIGSGDGTGDNDYGHLLTLESLINTIMELRDYSDGSKSCILTMGSANLEKIASVYVRLTGEAEEDASFPKIPCEVCESTDEGAMLITAYANSKNWTLA